LVLFDFLFIDLFKKNKINKIYFIDL